MRLIALAVGASDTARRLYSQDDSRALVVNQIVRHPSALCDPLPVYEGAATLLSEAQPRRHSSLCRQQRHDTHEGAATGETPPLVCPSRNRLATDNDDA